MEHERSCWVNCSFLTHWIEANCLTCFTKDLPVWKDNKNDFYIIANYKFNQQTYSFPIRIEKSKTSTFLKAFEVVQTGPNEYKETKNLTDLVKRWLGPNQDFYDKIITPDLLGVETLKVCFVDTESFDTVERVFTRHEPIVLAVSEEPPLPRSMSIQTYPAIELIPTTKPLEDLEVDNMQDTTGEAPYWIDSPAVNNDPREPFERGIVKPLSIPLDSKEPRKSFTFNHEQLIESHVR